MSTATPTGPLNMDLQSQAKRLRLTPEQIRFFNTEGYLLYKQPVFSDAKFQALKSHFEEKLLRLPPNVRPEAMDVPHFTDIKLFTWLFDDAVLDLVEPLLGPDIALFSSHFICKPKGNGKRVPWHEDSFYWKGTLDPMEVVTVWLAIDPSTPENGCMNVIPRSHVNGYSDYEEVDTAKNVFHIEILKAQMDPSRKVACTLNPNEASLHESKMIHGSDPNTSPIRRCGYTMRYISARSRLLRPNHQVYLARGKPQADNTYADPTKSYPELAQYREQHNKSGH